MDGVHSVVMETAQLLSSDPNMEERSCDNRLWWTVYASEIIHSVWRQFWRIFGRGWSWCCCLHPDVCLRCKGMQRLDQIRLKRLMRLEFNCVMHFLSVTVMFVMHVDLNCRQSAGECTFINDSVEWKWKGCYWTPTPPCVRGFVASAWCLFIYYDSCKNINYHFSPLNIWVSLFVFKLNADLVILS